uniref:Soluble scavenger receptor cysteine-rich domain-containing protein SSC5D n=1 Tax=Pelodiscus sinensis TaxID=13735 RepID=K7FHA6_PELSI
EIHLRLVNGSSRCSGRVEVLRNMQWGTVCDDGWDLNDAGVVCRQLSCAPGGARFGQGSERIWLDDVNCKGTEASLSECTARPWGDHNCNHGEDASAMCAGEIPLRLVNSSSRCAGRVEVLHNRQWGTVCDDSWDLTDAEVVCRQLGCGTALSAPKEAWFGQGSERIWLDDVSCRGTEDALSECNSRTWGEHNCNHTEDASAVCSGEIPLRLVNGSSRCAGRVEVLHNLQWGTVCDDSWDLTDAGVVCRQLGCGTALSAPGGARFGRGSERIWLDDVSCRGTEASLSECKSRSWGDHNCNHGEDANAVCSAGREILLRLVNGSSRCAGRVEVLHNQEWGTVCDDSWDLQDARVVCRQLGCGMALSAPSGAQFGQGSQHIWLDEVTCAGTESAISECMARPWGKHNCNHREDAGVVCSDSVIPDTVPLRLVNGSSHCAGRVEVLHNHKWGTVCDDSWDLQDAGVVCRQLGCGTALSAPGAAHFGQGSDIILLDEVQCTGTEAGLEECQARPWGEHNCNHGEDASVVCSVKRTWELRLVDGPNRCAGRVEVLHDQQWGTVCDDGWDLTEARVVCRQLGCGTALAAPHGSRFGHGTGRIWLDEVNCTGTEVALSECRAKPWGEHNCNHVEDAGVECSVFADPAPLRLVNGPNRCAGRVEVLHDQQWGTVCDDGWDLHDATVVCRQLGCGTALAAPGEAWFGYASDHIWLTDVNCTGTEAALSECRASPKGDNKCGHKEDASVRCSESADPGTAPIRLVNGLSRCAGRVEVFYNQRWGTVCDDSWDLQDAEVVCRQLGCGSPLSAPCSSCFGEGSGAIWLDDVHCTGKEAALSECNIRPWGDNNCNHTKDASVTCSDPPELRLADGPNRCAGRVEVLHDQQWGTVCDHDWDLTDAGVVCQQLGCGTAVAAPGQARFGKGSGAVWLNKVNCTGTEAALLDCGAQPGADDSCRHGDDAGAVCSVLRSTEMGPFLQGGTFWAAVSESLAWLCSPPPPLRLVNGPSRCAGRVEVLHDQQWGTVCDDGWDMQDAGVVCRQLGCGTALSAPGEAWFGQGSDRIWLDEVQCRGAEAALSRCRAQPWGDHNCHHGEDAGVVCSDMAPLRLANGSSRCAGRVEVLHDQQWGTVCDRGWDLQDAGVVCRQLGCGAALPAPHEARFGRGSGPIWLDDVRCTGTETALSDCWARPWGVRLCTPSSTVILTQAPQLRLANGPSRCAGRVEVFQYQQWGTVCDGGWDLQDAGVVCRQLGCGTALAAPHGAHFGPGSNPIWLDQVTCNGTEATLSECLARPWGDNKCHHGEDAGAVCSG